jgi:hypothetical protein
MTRIRAISTAGLPVLFLKGLFLTVLLLAAPLAAEPYLLDDPDARTLSESELAAEPGRFAFPPGERLVYSIRYWGVPVATARLEVARFLEWEGRRYAHVVGVGDTNDVFSTFYPIHDRTEAWIDLDTLRTHRTATHTRHGHDKETHERVDYEWDAHFLHMVEVKRHAKRRREVGFDFGPFVHDTFDAFYAVRALPLDVGSTAQLPIYANRKIYGLKVKVDRRERIEWNDERVETLVVKPRSLLDGAALGNGRGELHVRAEGRRVPLRLNGWFETTGGFKIGGVKAELVDWQPGDDGFVAAEAPPLRAAEVAVETRRGKPVWKVPDAVKQTRRERGLSAYSRKIPLDGFPNPAR